MPADSIYALSIKQPWVTLLLAGIKTIEIRKWSTLIRGPVLLHAAKIPDLRPEGWKLITEEWKSMTEYGGQVIGMAVLKECREYTTADQFRQDDLLHRNDPNWFQPPRMYGFVFEEPVLVRPLPVSGNVKFFTVDLVRTTSRDHG